MREHRESWNFAWKKTKQREYLCLNSILEKKELQKGEQEGAVFGELEGGGHEVIKLEFSFNSQMWIVDL